MKNKAKTAGKFGLAIAVAIAAFSLFACDLISPPPGLVEEPISRYEISSVKNASDRVLWSANNDESNFYFLHLGSVKDVPVAASAPVEYDGTTPVTVEFSKNTVDAARVLSFVQTCADNVVTAAVKIEKKVEPEVKDASFLGEATFINNALSKTFTDTYTTAAAKVKDLDAPVSYKVEGKTKPAGYYRYALLAACEVYSFVKTDRQNANLVSAEVYVAAKSGTYKYALDYDADKKFARATDTAAIDIAADFYKDLPIPDIDATPLLIFDTGDGGDKEVPRNIAVGNAFPLTLVVEPKRENYIFNGWNTNGHTTMPEASKFFTVTAKWEKTGYLTVLREGRNIDITSDSSKDEIKPGFNIAALKSAGYTKYTLYVTFDLTEKSNGTQRLRVHSGGNEIGGQKYDHGGGSTDKNWKNYTFSGTYDLTDASNSIILEWDSPKDNVFHINTWLLGTTWVSVTAIK